MHPSVLKLFRLFAWTAVVSGLVLLTLGYAALPPEIPVTRWTMAAKTPLLVLRIPLINLLSLALVMILERSLVRTHAASPFRENAMMALTALYATVGTKAFLEAFELIALPTVHVWMFWILAVLVAGGLALAALTGLPFLRRTTNPRATFTIGEKVVALLVVAGIVALQFFPMWNDFG